MVFSPSSAFQRYHLKRDLTERIDGVLIHSGVVKAYADLLKKPMDALLGKGPLHPIKSLLNGRWLEHPLHPVLVAVPIGAWSVVVLLDLLSLIFRVPNLGLASGIAIALGVLGALAAIVTASWIGWMLIHPNWRSA